jgi:hypothetical protein
MMSSLILIEIEVFGIFSLNNIFSFFWMNVEKTLFSVVTNYIVKRAIKVIKNYKCPIFAALAFC